MQRTSADTIVVVDDDPLVASVVANALRDLAIAVRCPATTEHAVEWLIEARYRLAVVDVILPGRSGIEVGAIAARKGTPVLLMTGSFDAGATLSSYGFFFLQKPVPITTLVQEARMMIGQRQDVCAAFLAAVARMETDTGRLWC